MKNCIICDKNDSETRIIKHSGQYYCRKHYLQIYRHGKICDTIYDPNKITIQGDVAYIELKDKYGNVSGQAIINSDDVEKCAKYKWHLKKSRNTNYVITTLDESHKLFLHRLITGYTGSDDIDHINHNGLDNRRCNLRVLSHSQNIMNQHNALNGVYKTNTGKYRATIAINGKSKYLGTFDNAEDAISARKVAEGKYI